MLLKMSAIDRKKSRKEGFTLIELIMTMVIVMVLAAAGVFIFSFLMQDALYIPNKLNVDMLASEVMDFIIEGDEQARGLRFNQAIQSIVANDVTFVNQQNQTIRYRINANQFKRSINGVESVVPYYQSAFTNVVGNGNGGALFTYIDSNDNITNTVANVRRIRIDLIAQTGTGLFSKWEGQSALSSSVTVK